MKKLLTLLLFLFYTGSYSQINENLNFDSTGLPTGWTMSEFDYTSFWDYPCDGQSLFSNLLFIDVGWWEEEWDGITSASLTTKNFDNIYGPITIGFDFRISDYYDDPEPLTDFDYGNIYVEFSFDNGSVWVQHSTINQANFTMNDEGCTRYTTTIPQVNLQQGPQIKMRIRIETPRIEQNEYDIAFYLDNLSIVQQDANNCLNPTAVAVNDISSTAALFSWVAPIGSAPLTSYSYEVRTSGLPGSGSLGLVTSGTTTELEKLIDILEPNKNHYFFIKSVCGAGAARNWVALAEFRTPCAVLPNVIADDQMFCGTARVADLIAEPNETATLIWYNSPTAFTALDPQSVLVNGTYYGAFLLNGCYSPERTAVVVTMNPKPVAPIIQNQSFCGSSVIGDIPLVPLTGLNLRWYNHNRVEINGQMPLTTGTYYVSHYNATCESDWTAFEINIRDTPPALVLSDQFLCGRHEIASIAIPTANGSTAQWYANADDATALARTTIVGNATYYIAQTNGTCESERVAINITIYDAVPTPMTNNQNFCSATATVADLQITGMTGASLHWYDTPTSIEPLSPNELLTTDIYYATQSWGDCESPRVSIIVNVTAFIGVLQIVDQHFCEAAEVADLRVTVPEGMQAKWYRDAEGGYPLSADIPLENGIYYVAQAKNGCESARIAFRVTIEPKPASPTGQAIQSIVEGSRISDLLITATNPKWFGSLLDLEANRNQLSPETGLLDNTFYYVVNQSNTGCFSDPLIIKVLLTLGVNDFDLKSFSYYPNPTTDWLNIHYKEVIKAYEIYDVKGKKVGSQQPNDNKIQVDLSALASGVYIIQLHTAAQNQSIKVIKK
ncbi:T9SS type A sorting domain-containing protein [Flavobacterium sp. NKUCC04_CG]|uniref:Ig-like domain-containing protein n=1 Tax=Flavobacterium sp. NKUCC04_CG TaxID=2842121 RepID=UPI001C5B3DF4|nr:T9SS type A sorting domain-containing protein [Flavobacterium sp. NKUCC04_CG]MBW3520365.1 T9SS type A sorting domain-containing protein [Flavobacterium sp. NKUCC04_CG]